MRNPSYDAPTAPVEHHDPAPVLLLLLAGLLTGVGTGLWLFWPFLVREHERMGLLPSVLLWSGDVAALVSFLGYCVWHVTMGVPVRATVGPTEKLDRRLKVVTTGLVVALAVDLGTTLVLMEREDRAFARALRTEATVTRVRRRKFPFGTVYALDARFTDTTGTPHDATFLLQDDEKAGLPWIIPLATQGAVRRGRVPFSIGVAFDPDHPGRNWLLGARWFDQERLHFFSLVVISAQLVAIALFALALEGVVRSRRQIPWWHDLHMVLPLAIEVAGVAAVSLGELNYHRVTWWM
jgi:hypothetical protein